MRLAVLLAMLPIAAPPGAAEGPSWRAVWVWSMPQRTEADLAHIVQSARELGFNVLLMLPPRDKVEFMAQECRRAGMKLYLSTVFTGGEPGLQQVMTDAQEERVGRGFAEDYQVGGEPVRDDELLQTPLPCWNRPQVRELFAQKVRDLAALPADGLAFDFIGYRNYERCHCPVCEEHLAAFREAHPRLRRTAAERRWAEDVLVEFTHEMADVARKTRPGIGLTIHVYPFFRPNPYYGYRLNLDYTGETVAWFFRPHWSLQKVASRVADTVSRQGERFAGQRAAPFVGFDGRKARNYRSARRVGAELRLIVESGAEGLQVAELGYLLERPLVARAVAEALERHDPVENPSAGRTLRPPGACSCVSSTRCGCAARGGAGARLSPTWADDAVLHGPQILRGCRQGDGTFGRDDLNPGIETFAHLCDDMRRGAVQQGAGVVDVAHEGDPGSAPVVMPLGVHDVPRPAGGDLRVEVEAGEAGVGDVCEAVGGISADVQDGRAGHRRRDPAMHRPQELAVHAAGDEVAGGVVADRDGVRPGLELCPREQDGDTLEAAQYLMHLGRVVEGHDQERLDAEQVVGQRPGAEDLADERHVGVARAQDAQGIEHDAAGRSSQEIVRRRDVVGGPAQTPDDVGHHVAPSPVDLAAEGRRLVLNREDRRDGVIAQDFVACGGQPGHDLRVEMGVGEGATRGLHQLQRGHGDGISHAGAVRRLPAQAGEEPRARGHGRVLAVRGPFTSGKSARRAGGISRATDIANAVAGFRRGFWVSAGLT